MSSLPSKSQTGAGHTISSCACFLISSRIRLPRTGQALLAASQAFPAASFKRCMLNCSRIRPTMASQQILRRLGARRSSVVVLVAPSGACKPLVDAGSIRAVSSLTSGSQTPGSTHLAAADPQPKQLAGAIARCISSRPLVRFAAI